MMQYAGVFLTVFVTVFLAELGDKTQLATLLFATDGRQTPWLVFVAAASALIATTALAVVVGVAAERYVNGLPLKLIAGLGFIAIGIWTMYSHYTGA
jgi:putative Ca2+/H+ antiporter (TMEM165/GDT1 family)